MSASKIAFSLKERFMHLEQTSSNYCIPNYLSEALNDNSKNIKRWADRVLLVRRHNISSLFDIVDHYKIDREVVSAAAYIIDQYLAKWLPTILDGEAELPFELDVISMTSLFIIIKSQVGNMSDIMIPPISSLLPRYSKELLNHAEVSILFALQWNVLYPTPVMIVRDLLMLQHCHWGLQEHDHAFKNYKRSIYIKAKYITELTTMEYDFVAFRPTTIALAAIMVAVETIDEYRSNDCFPPVDPLHLFKDAVNTHLGEIQVTCDNSDVQRCHEKMLCICNSSGTFEGSTVTSVAITTTPRPVTP